MVRRYTPTKKKKTPSNNRGAVYVDSRDVNRDKKTGKVTINKGATANVRDGKDGFKSTKQDVSGEVKQKTNGTKELSEKFRQKTAQEKQRFDKTGLSDKKFNEVNDAVNKPFTDPKGFIKDTFSKENLKETLPLALGEAGAFKAVGGLVGRVFGNPTISNSYSKFMGNKLGKLSNKAMMKEITNIANSGGVKTISKNTKTEKLAIDWTVNKLVSTGKWSKNKVVALVTALAAYATSTAIGQQQMSEAPESINYLMDDLRWRAKETGDWTEVHDAEDMIEDIKNLSSGQTIMKWTPASVFLGASLKTAASTKNLMLQKKLNEDLEYAQVNGETEDDTFMRNQQEMQAMKQETNEKYIQGAKELAIWKQELEKQGRKESADFWKKKEKEKEKQKMEDLKAIGDYWEAYAKEKEKQRDNSRPSNLNFGLV